MANLRIISGRELIAELIRAGVIDRLVQRCVIDIGYDEVVKIYTQKVADDRILSVSFFGPEIVVSD